MLKRLGLIHLLCQNEREMKRKIKRFFLMKYPYILIKLENYSIKLDNRSHSTLKNYSKEDLNDRPT